MSLALEITLKVSLVLGIGLAIMPLLRRQSAALRHFVLTVAIASAALVPLGRPFLPSWQLPIDLPPRESVSTPARTTHSVASAEPTTPIVRGAPAAATERLSVDDAVVTVWIAGALFGIAMLLSGLARLARMTVTAARITEGLWVQRAAAIGGEDGLRRAVTLRQGSHPTLLVTWGVIRPTIILPAASREWGEDRVSLVLRHELAHVRRGDWIVQLAAEIVRAAYWFNPLAWIACARLRQESEQACDDAVINRGVGGSEYAAHLVEIARELRKGRPWLPAPAIAETSLERRIRAMLAARHNRRPLSRAASAAILFGWLALAVPIAGLAGEQAFARFAGSIVDPQNAVLPGVTLVLSRPDSGARYEVRSDREGRFEFTGLAPGEYQLETKLPGFAAFRGSLTLAGQNVEQDLTLQVGTVQETISVRGSPSDDATARPSRDPQKMLEIQRKRAAAKCPATPLGGGAAPAIGGNLRAPMKIADVRPVYPEALRAAGTGGTVLLEGRIGVEGNIENLNVASATHNELAAAAVDAVQQWQFDATLLNCVPIDVGIKVTVNFQAQ